MLPSLKSSLIFLLIFAFQSRICLSLCPQAQASVTLNGQQTCVDQAVITAKVRPTPDTFVYMIVFEGGTVPFTSLSDFESNTFIRLSSTSQTLSTDPQSFTSLAMNSDLTIIQLALLLEEVPYGTEMTVSFTDFSTSDSRVSYIKSPVVLSVQSVRELSASSIKIVEVLTDIDFILEIVWIVVSILSPYWILYMDCKLYRETLNMLKQLNVQYEPFVYHFYRLNDRKTSGLKVPNVFGIFVLGNNFATEWTKYPQNEIGLNFLNSARTDDVKVLVDSQFLKYNSFALFLDNYGVELTIILGLLIAVIVLEALFKVLKLKNNEKLWSRVFRKIKQITRSCLLMTAVGSCQSLVFYAGIQLLAFLSERTTHNLISFGITLAIIVTVIVCAIIYIVWTLKKRNRIYPSDSKVSETQGKSLGFFRPILSFYKSGKLIYPFFILLYIGRAITFAIFTIALISAPITQASIMLCITLGFIAALIVFRPFARLLYTVFKILYELVLFLTFALLLALAVEDSKNSFSIEQRESLGLFFLALWVAVPLLTVIFGVIGIVQYAKQFHTKRKTSSKSTKSTKSNKVAPTKESKEVKVLVLERKLTQSEKVNKEVLRSQKTTSIVDSPSASPSMALMSPDGKRDPPDTGRSGYSDSEAQLMAERSRGNLFFSNRQAMDVSTILDAHNDDSTIIKNTSIPGRPRTFSDPKKPQVDSEKSEGSPLLINNKSLPPVKSIFNKLRDIPKQNSERIVVKKKRNFDVLELKLTPQSLKVIDDAGFREHVGGKDEDF